MSNYEPVRGVTSQRCNEVPDGQRLDEPTMEDVRKVTSPIIDQFEKGFPNPTLAERNRLRGALIRAAAPYFWKSAMLRTKRRMRH